jgi:hypothetical protein
VLNYIFHLKENEEKVEQIISSIERFQIEMHPEFNLISLAVLTQTNFNSVDKKFNTFGKFYLQNLKDSKIGNSLTNLILDSFSQLVLRNIGFSNSELFPKQNIQEIASKLQVELLSNGKYFRMLPGVLNKCSDENKNATTFSSI